MAVMSMDAKDKTLCLVSGAFLASLLGWSALKRYYEGRGRRSGEPPVVWSNQWGKDALNDRPEDWLRESHRIYGDVFTVRMDRQQYMTFVWDPACWNEVLSSPFLAFPATSRKSKNRFGITSVVEKDEGVRSLSIAMRTAFQRDYLQTAAVDMQLLYRQKLTGVLGTAGGDGSTSCDLFQTVVGLALLTNAETIFGQGMDPEKMVAHFLPFNQGMASRFAGAKVNDAEEHKHHTAVLQSLLSSCFAEDANVSQMLKCMLEWFEGKEIPTQERYSTLTMLLWGALVNTTGTAFWTLYHVFSEGCAEELREGLKKVAPEGPHGTYSLKQLDGPALQFVKSVVMETIRVRSRPNFYREVAKDHALATSGSQSVRTKDWVAVFPRLYHTDPTIFPEPEKFKWNRFVRNARSSTKKMPGVYAFGKGDGLCPGERHAYLIIMSMVIEVVKNYDIRIDGKEPRQEPAGVNSVPWPSNSVQISAKMLGQQTR